MSTVMVVDDHKLDQRLAGSLLETRTDLNVGYAKDGQEALDKMHREPADIILTDMQMPRVDGLQLVEAIRRDYPAVPVILMTAHGSEQLAADALSRGAASYVPKTNISRDLVPTIERVMAAAGKAIGQDVVLQHLVRTEHTFCLLNDLQHVPLINFVRGQIAQMGVADDTEMTRLGVALDEAIDNAILHGNLECDAEDPTQLNQRAASEPFARRRVQVTVRTSQDKIEFVVRDDGHGFDVTELPDPSDPENLERTAGRGLLLIHTFMDEVRHNGQGNEITMIKQVRKRTSH